MILNKINAYVDTEAISYPLNQGKLHIFRVTWEDGAVVSGKISIYHTSNIHYSEHINKVSRVLQASAEKKIKQTLVAGDFIYSESSKTFQFIKDRNGFTGLVDCLLSDKYRMELRMAA